MSKYQERFGECVDGVCTLSTTRQSAITGLLSVGAVIGAVGSGSIADRVSRFPWLVYLQLRNICRAVLFWCYIAQIEAFAVVAMFEDKT